MSRKEKRIVEIPAEPISFEDYSDLKSHAVKSSLWYLERYPSHSSKIRQRLIEKGYEEGAFLCFTSPEPDNDKTSTPVNLKSVFPNLPSSDAESLTDNDNSGTTAHQPEHYDFIEETIAYLAQQGVLDDNWFLERRLSSYIQSGLGISGAKRKLVALGIPYQDVDDFLESSEDVVQYDDIIASALKAGKKIARSSSFRKRSGFERSAFFKGKMFERGFSSDIIQETYETLIEEAFIDEED